MLETTVTEVRTETSDSVTLRLDLGGVAFAYRPGQYIEVDPHQFEELAPAIAASEAKKGFPESPRSFSIASDGTEEGFLEISVKEEHPGPALPIVTPFLVRRAKPGLKIRITGPNGQYCLPPSAPPYQGFLHLCAGSGVAPNRGMIRHALARGWPQRHLLVLQNRTPEDVFYNTEWPALLARHGDRLRVRHVYSVRDKEHVTPEIIRSLMDDWLEGRQSMAFVCGPNRPRLVDGKKEPGFCERWVGNPRRRVLGLLDGLGFTPDRILTEMW